MDTQLEALFRQAVEPGCNQQPIEIHEEDGTVHLQTPDGPKVCPIKSLSELYGAGTGSDVFDPSSARFLPLLLPIEETILDYANRHHSLTDAQVLLTLNQLAMNPDTPPANDPLGQHIRFALRIVLSLNDFSRAEVRQALRKVAKSVDRHSRDGGTRGYLTFIRSVLRRG